MRPADAAIVKSVASAFPMVTSVRVREALETVGTVVTNLVMAIRGASAVTLISAILVLGGALAAGHRTGSMTLSFSRHWGRPACACLAPMPSNT